MVTRNRNSSVTSQRTQNFSVKSVFPAGRSIHPVRLVLSRRRIHKTFVASITGFSTRRLGTSGIRPAIPDAEDRWSNSMGEVTGAIPSPRPDQIPRCASAPRTSQIANSPIEDGIVPAVAAGILVARITNARCTGSAGGTRPSAVCLAIIENGVAVFAPRNRGDNRVRPDSDQPAAIVSTHCLQRLLGSKSRHIHSVHFISPFGWLRM